MSYFIFQDLFIFYSIIKWNFLNGILKTDTKDTVIFCRDRTQKVFLHKSGKYN